MFSELVDGLEELIHCLALYVAHDTSIMHIMAEFGMFPLCWPRLGSEIFIEVCHSPILTADDWTHSIHTVGSKTIAMFGDFGLGGV